MAAQRRIGRAERSLLARCRRLDTSALHAVLYRYADDVYERLITRTRDRGEAEQAFEQVFRRFLDQAGGLSGSRSVLEHLLAITDAVAPPADVEPRPRALREAQFVELVPRAELVARVEAAILQDAPALARDARHGARLATRQIAVVVAGVVVVVATVLAARVQRVEEHAREAKAKMAAEAVVRGDLVEELGTWIQREQQASPHGDARRHDLEELRLVLEEVASLDAPGKPAELAYIAERLRQRDLIDLAYELSKESGSQAERRRMRLVAELLEEVSVL